MIFQTMKKAFQFYLLACLFSWTISLPLVLPAFGIDHVPALPYHHAFVGLGPMIAAFFINALYEGCNGIKKLLRGMRHAANRWTLLVAAFAPFVLLLLATAIHYFKDGVTPDFSLFGRTSQFPQFNLAIYFLYNFFFFGFGEETGWKGIMLPIFQRKWSALAASIIFTFFWALWHLPLFFYRPGYVSMDAAGVIGWLFSLLTGSILLTWLFNSSSGSILVCAVFHATVDVAFVSDFANTTVVGYLGFLITVWGIATIFLFGAKNLSRENRIKE